MNKQQIAEKIAMTEYDISANKIRQIIEHLIDIITQTLQKNEPVKINKLGTFLVKKVKGRPVINPRTGQKMMLQSYKAVKFRASETIKRKIKQKKV